MKMEVNIKVFNNGKLNNEVDGVIVDKANVAQMGPNKIEEPIVAFIKNKAQRKGRV